MTLNLDKMAAQGDKDLLECHRIKMPGCWLEVFARAVAEKVCDEVQRMLDINAFIDRDEWQYMRRDILGNWKEEAKP